jgi:hypothetical protein
VDPGQAHKKLMRAKMGPEMPHPSMITDWEVLVSDRKNLDPNGEDWRDQSTVRVTTAEAAKYSQEVQKLVQRTMQERLQEFYIYIDNTSPEQLGMTLAKYSDKSNAVRIQEMRLRENQTDQNQFLVQEWTEEYPNQQVRVLDTVPGAESDKVVLEYTRQKQFGMNLPKNRDSVSTVRIKEIRGGLVQKWNQENPPSKQVKVMDIILAVNDLVDSDEILREYTRKKALCFRVLRYKDLETPLVEYLPSRVQREMTIPPLRYNPSGRLNEIDAVERQAYLYL